MSRRVGRLQVHEHGDPGGPVLLLLHGVTDAGTAWSDLVERLGVGLRLVAPDALGHGGSDRFSAAELADDPVAAMTEAAEVLLEELAHDSPALLLGHSMGAATAADLAARRPELVRAAVLEDPPWHPARPDELQAEVVEERVRSAREAAADPEAAVARCRVEHPTWPASELPAWAAAKADVDLDFLATGRVLPTTPWQDTVAALVAPTLLVTGDGDVRVTAPVRDEIAALGNPALSVEVVAGAGHCVRRDRGDAFHALVDPWLRGLAA